MLFLQTSENFLAEVQLDPCVEIWIPAPPLWVWFLGVMGVALAMGVEVVLVEMCPVSFLPP